MAAFAFLVALAVVGISSVDMAVLRQGNAVYPSLDAWKSSNPQNEFDNDGGRPFYGSDPGSGGDSSYDGRYDGYKIAEGSRSYNSLSQWRDGRPETEFDGPRQYNSPMGQRQYNSPIPRSPSSGMPSNYPANEYNQSPTLMDQAPAWSP